MNKEDIVSYMEKVNLEHEAKKNIPREEKIYQQVCEILPKDIFVNNKFYIRYAYALMGLSHFCIGYHLDFYKYKDPNPRERVLFEVIDEDFNRAVVRALLEFNKLKFLPSLY